MNITPKKVEEDTKYRKQTVPKAVREQVWVLHLGKKFESKCYIPWCHNHINCFNFHVGHDKPESKGGALEIRNLKPICDRCNLSMGNRYTIQEWSESFTDRRGCLRSLIHILTLGIC